MPDEFFESEQDVGELQAQLEAELKKEQQPNPGNGHSIGTATRLQHRHGEAGAQVNSEEDEAELITRNEFGQGTVGVEEKKQFFRAVALVRSLKELHMPQWKAFVGGHAGFCCEPLRSIPWLRMLVPTVQQSPAFPPGLIFQATK